MKEKINERLLLRGNWDDITILKTKTQEWLYWPIQQIHWNWLSLKIDCSIDWYTNIQVELMTIIWERNDNFDLEGVKGK